MLQPKKFTNTKLCLGSHRRHLSGSAPDATSDLSAHMTQSSVLPPGLGDSSRSSNYLSTDTGHVQRVQSMTDLRSESHHKQSKASCFSDMPELIFNFIFFKIMTWVQTGPLLHLQEGKSAKTDKNCLVMYTPWFYHQHWMGWLWPRGKKYLSETWYLRLRVLSPAMPTIF